MTGEHWSWPCSVRSRRSGYSRFSRATRGDQVNGDEPGMAWRDIAASAYRAYAASTGNKNFRGDPMPAFDELPHPIRTAWEAAVRQAGSCLNIRMAKDAPPDESRWAGWVPPGS